MVSPLRDAQLPPVPPPPPPPPPPPVGGGAAAAVTKGAGRPRPLVLGSPTREPARRHVAEAEAPRRDAGLAAPLANATYPDDRRERVVARNLDCSKKLRRRVPSAARSGIAGPGRAGRLSTDGGEGHGTIDRHALQQHEGDRRRERPGVRAIFCARAPVIRLAQGQQIAQLERWYGRPALGGSRTWPRVFDRNPASVATSTT